MAKTRGPDRLPKEQFIPVDYQHDFDEKDICKRCGAESFTKGALCTGSQLTPPIG